MAVAITSLRGCNVDSAVSQVRGGRPYGPYPYGYDDYSPSTASDPDSAWTDELNAVDGNDATFATKNWSSSDSITQNHLTINWQNVFPATKPADIGEIFGVSVQIRVAQSNTVNTCRLNHGVVENADTSERRLGPWENEWTPSGTAPVTQAWEHIPVLSAGARTQDLSRRFTYTWNNLRNVQSRFWTSSGTLGAAIKLYEVVYRLHHDRGDTLYVVGISNVTTRMQVQRSADDGDTWAAQDVAGQPATVAATIDNFAVTRWCNLLYITQLDTYVAAAGKSAGSYQIKMHSFGLDTPSRNVSANSWFETDIAVASSQSFSVNPTRGNHAAMGAGFRHARKTASTNADPLVVECMVGGATAKDMGTDYLGVDSYYAELDAGASARDGSFDTSAYPVFRTVAWAAGFNFTGGFAYSSLYDNEIACSLWEDATSTEALRVFKLTSTTSTSMSQTGTAGIANRVDQVTHAQPAEPVASGRLITAYQNNVSPGSWSATMWNLNGVATAPTAVVNSNAAISGALDEVGFLPAYDFVKVPGTPGVVAIEIEDDSTNLQTDVWAREPGTHDYDSIDLASSSATLTKLSDVAGQPSSTDTLAGASVVYWEPGGAAVLATAWERRSSNTIYFDKHTLVAGGLSPVNATDNLGLTDTISRVAVYDRSASDNLGLTDSITTELVAVRDVSDTLGLTDSVAAERLLFREDTDNLGLTDSITIEIGYSEDLSDNLGLTDSFTFTQDIALDTQDDLGLTDSTSLEIGVAVDVSDSLGLTDALDPFAQTVDATDDTGLTDAGKRVDFIGDISNDAIGLTDSITVEAFLGVDATDNLGLTDSAVLDVVLDRQDDLDLTDATDPFGFTVDDTNNLGLTDSITIEIGFARDYTDNLGLTDTASDDSGEAHSDDLDLTDVATWQADLDRGDNLGLTDSISVEVGEAVDASDTLGLTDSISFTQDFGPDVSDSLDLTDSDERVWDATRDFSDSLGLTDSFTTEFSGAGTLDTSDNLGLTDSITVELTVTVDTADTLGLTDSFSLEIDTVLDVTDDLGLSDSATFDTTLTVDATDNLGLTDSFTTVRSVAVETTDTLGLTDSFDSDETTTLNVTDNAGLTDSFTRDAIAYVRDYSDSLGITESFFTGAIPIESARFSLEPARQANARSGSSIVNSRKHRRTLTSREGR